MKRSKQDFIEAQLTRAEEAFTMARLAIEARLWNSAANELYYACFYLIQTLFSSNDLHAHTHSGIRTLFSSKFIKENKLDEKYGKLFTKLFERRQEGNYGDNKLTEDNILPLINEIEEFKTKILALLENSGNKNMNAL